MTYVTYHRLRSEQRHTTDDGRQARDNEQRATSNVKQAPYQSHAYSLLVHLPPGLRTWRNSCNHATSGSVHSSSKFACICSAHQITNSRPWTPPFAAALLLNDHCGPESLQILKPLRNVVLLLFDTCRYRHSPPGQRRARGRRRETR